ncbi:MAG: DUF2953 domain-containing protein [Ruminococcaceae bacterium]|nr:DUF2953 domain-containing protein [Oscillospiraceae bacterium]
MIALYIIGGILLLVFLLLMLRVRITLSYSKSPTDKGGASAVVWIGPVRIKLYPKKKKKIKLSDYSPKKYRRLMSEDVSKKSEPADTGEKKKEKILPGELSEILDLVGDIAEKFTSHLRCEILRIRLNIGTKNAAVTAVAYAGAVSAVELLLELLGNLTDMRLRSPKDIFVNADFENGTVHGDVCIRFSIRVINILRAGGGIIKSYIKRMIRMESQASKNNKNKTAIVRKNGDNYEQ